MNLNIEDIKKLIPHREPFLFIDGCRVIEKGKSGESFRTFYDNDLRWLKHFGFIPLDIPSISGGLSR